MALINGAYRSDIMTSDDLQTLIEQLKGEVDALEAGDSHARERLQALVAMLELRVDEGADLSDHEELIQSLRDGVEQFEVAHPRATGILNQIMVMLANIGI